MGRAFVRFGSAPDIDEPVWNVRIVGLSGRELMDRDRSAISQLRTFVGPHFTGFSFACFAQIALARTSILAASSPRPVFRSGAA